MKRLLALLAAAFCLLAAGCDEEIEYTPTVGDLTPRHGYRYDNARDCGAGCLYEKDGAWRYYNYGRRENVSVCSDPLCGHTKDSCFARISGNVYGYGNRLYYAATEFDYNNELGEYSEYVIKEADIASQTKREVLRIKGCGRSDAFAYGDKLFVGLYENYIPEGGSADSERVRVYLMAVSLEMAETVLMTDCITDGFNTRLSIYGIENGKLIFSTSCYENGLDGDDAPDDEPHTQTIKHMSCDIETLEIAEYGGRIANQYLDECSVYFDGGAVCFDRGGDISRLEIGAGLEYVPFYVEYYSGGKAYFRVEGNKGMIYRFDTDTEKMYVSSFSEIDGMELIAEREKDFAFINGNNDIVMLSKDKQLIFTELDGERIRTVFENYKNSRPDEGMTDEELEEFISSILSEDRTEFTPMLY